MKLVPKTGNVIARSFARLALVSRRTYRSLWPHGTKFIQPIPKWLRTSVIALVIIGSAAFGGEQLLRITGDDVNQEAWSVAQITHITQNRLKAIANALDSTRDWLVNDQLIESAIASNNSQKLFSLLGQRDQAYSYRLPDSAVFSTLSDERTIANRGYAVYSAEGRLMAWYSPAAATFGFDTVLSGPMRLPSRDQGLMLENGPIYAYLVAVRKIVSIDGQVEAFIVAKQQLATKEPLTSSPTSSFIDDIKQNSGRNLVISFGDRKLASHLGTTEPNSTDSISLLLADPSDPTSFVGSLAVQREAKANPSLQFETLQYLSVFAFTFAVFAMLIWLLVAISDVPQIRRPIGARIVYSFTLFISLSAARIIIAQLGGFAKLFGQQYQNGSDFSSGWGFGIAANPLELFITTVFVTALAVMIWIVWLPRERLVRDDSRVRELAPIKGSERLGLIISALGALLVSKLLVDGLSSVIEFIIQHGNVRYLTVTSVLPAPGMLMMFLSFLGIGVTYLFLGTFALTVALRATINLTSRKQTLPVRIFIGSFALAILIVAGLVFLGDLVLTETTLAYRAGLAALTFIVSVAIIVIDARVPDPLDEGPSFLYNLPRSSRPIFFIISISAIIIGPLVANKQLLNDEDIAGRIVLKNSKVDIPELKNAAESLLNKAQDRLSEWNAVARDSSALHNEAFLIWLDGMRERPAWNTSIDVFNSNGGRISHFATVGIDNELDRIRSQSDSEFAQLRHSDSSKIASRIITSFTSSGTPAIIAGLRFQRPSNRLTDSSKPIVAITNTSSEPIYVTVSIWSDLQVLPSQRVRISIVPEPSGTNTDQLSNGELIIAQYRPGMRRITNSPSLDVPANVPDPVVNLLKMRRSVWRTTVIGGARYQTLYYRASTQGANGERPTIIAVSVLEPSIGRTLEFALRLNAIGLLYGAIIVISLLIVRQMSERRWRFTLHFRDRIFLIVLLIALVPLVVVTYVTRDLLAERARVEEQDRLSRDASVIKDRMTRKIELAGSASDKNDLQSEVEYLSQVIGRDFSVYDPNGRLRASSRPELYESSMLAGTLNSTAVQEVILGKRSFFIEPVEVGSETFNVGYQPVTNTGGDRLLAILAIATTDEKPQIEAEIARTTSFIYGTFAALGLILLGIGALFAARVAKPILELIRATEQVAKGRLKTSIPVKREDEIGDLMHAFNTMTRELENSREIVAQTERELAWKEMARQVAHEIKNPLTPMKLSVQHLEHAHERSDPNFNTIFRRVIRTLREQIDVLTRIATEFSHFGAFPRRKWGPVEIRTVAESAVALFDADRSRIRFIIDVPKDLPKVHSDEEELRRALVNLLRNSSQAIEGWGVIVIRGRSDQGMVHVTVRDTGFGMQEETLKKVFDPNFSTKTSGMGLGLAIVKKTITDMSGTIRVESMPGQGTTFFIDLPARTDAEEDAG